MSKRKHLRNEGIGLVLGRRVNERILIGEGEDQIVLTVHSIDRGVTRIGIKAPAHIPVHREEVYEAIQREGRTPQRMRGGPR